MSNREPEIQTFTGKFVNFLNPQPNTIDIVDIAHALAMVNRYAGHTPLPYSVAQHSVLCSHQVPEHLAFEALMHDAQEAYVGDVPSTLKQILPDYQVVEWKLEEVIRDKFGLPREMTRAVKEADLGMMAAEVAHFGFTWGDRIDVPAAKVRIEAWPWQLARRSFLRRFYDLAPARI